jgi:glutathione S-transferase
MRLYDYTASGNCYKVRLLLALLGEPYERVPIDIFGGDTLTDAFGALNPLRETPLLELGEDTVITQSPAILWYLAEETPFLPATRTGRAQVAQWLAFEQERVMGAVGGARFRVLTGRASADDPLIAGRLAVAADTLDLLAAQLAGRRFLVGEEPTIADVAVFAYSSRAGDIGLPLDRRPALERWADRIRALPGFLDDFERYPANARPGAGRSIYDS